jgi:predicted nuclease of restriction endonuclease-like (RecB) superfamily
MRVTDQAAQAYYLKEANDQKWAVRTLERNINTLYYRRLLSSQIQQPVIDEMIGIQ